MPVLRLLDLEHPFFAPLWRRIVTTAVCVVWAGVELAAGSIWFALIAAALAALCIWRFFFGFVPRESSERPRR
jgi:hypothetical protein